MSENDDNVTKAFEQNLQRMLRRASEPPPYRQAFYDDLLARLKEQQNRARSERRLQQIHFRHYAYSGLVGMAAAAAILLLVAPWTDTGLAQSQPPLNPSLRVQSPAAIPLPTPAKATPLLSRQSIMLAQTKALGGLQYRKAKDAAWQTFQTTDDLTLKDGWEVRLPEAIGEAIVVMQTLDGAAFSLKPGTCIGSEGGRLALHQGGLPLTVAEKGSPLPVRVQGRDLDIAPGSEVYLKATDESAYAQGGAPAPVVMVVKGCATTRGSFCNRLPAGYYFTLFDTPTGYVPGQSLHDLSPPPARREAKTLSPGVQPASAPATPSVRRVEVLALGDHTFQSMGDRWLDVQLASADPLVSVPRGSSMYEQLLCRYPELSRIAALGREVVVKLGNQAYEIEDPAAK